jgi:FdhD protein
MARPAAIEVSRAQWRGGLESFGRRSVPEETPVALTYNGSAHAVMMATPADLGDFAIGFSLAEGVVEAPSEIASLDIVEVEDGIEARMWLEPSATARHQTRRRTMLGPTGCGLCGVESIGEALKSNPRVGGASVRVSRSELTAAMVALQKEQALNAQTRAVHAAGLWLGPGRLLVREDVGRHNALDKVIGAAASAALPADGGVVLLTSRVSVELVQKTARLGAPIMAAVSAPTALAIRVAEDAGITLVALLRGDDFEIFTKPERIAGEASSHAA